MTKPLKILILEDSATDAELIQRLLKKETIPYEFRLAMNKEEFLGSLEEFSPDIILSDNSLPQFNAIEALKIVRQRLPNIPFILVTGTVSDEFAANIIKSGADDYILKDRLTRLPVAIDAALNQRKAEKEIKDYRFALDQTAIVAITDPKGIIIYANENFCSISKYAVEELIGQDHRIINSGYHPASYIKNLWRTIAHGMIWRGEFRNKAKDGSLYWVDTTIIPFLDENGKPYQYLSIRIDITEKKQAEEKLAEREQQLRLFVENSPAAIVMLDKDMKYIVASKRWLSDYNLADKEMIGKSHYEVFPDIPEHWKEVHRRCLAGAIEKKEEDLFTRADGSVDWIRWEIHPWHKLSGEVGGIILLTEVITERKKAAEKILQSEQQYRDLVDNISDLVCTHDLDGNILSVNRAAEKLTGFKFDPKRSMNIKDLLIPGAKDEFDNYIAGIKKNGYGQGLMKIKTLTGEIRIWEYRNSLKTTVVSSPIVRGYARDITESRKAEENLRQSEARLNEAQAITHISNWEMDLIQKTHKRSDEFYRIYGINKIETEPSTELFLSFMHPDDAGVAQKKVQEAFDSRKDSSFNFRFIRKDGITRHGYVEWRFEFDKKGNPVRVFGILQDTTERVEAEENLKLLEKEILEQKIQEQKIITRAIIKAQERERNRIGQELHDNINQILAGAKMYLSMTGNRDVKMKDLIKYPMELIDSCIQEIRLLSSKQVTPLKDIDLKELIQSLLENVTKETTIKTNFVYKVINEAIDDDLKLNIYRIIQEQMNNIMKHADPKNVNISVQANSKTINVVVSDDGRGFNVSKKRKGIGISNIINRIESFNGEVAIQSSPGNGCAVQIKIPY